MVTDYIPTGLVLNDVAWTNTNPTQFIAPISVTSGSSITIPITFMVNGLVTGTFSNRAEISADDGSDVDSTPDQNLNNDTYSGDNNISGTGVDDEDDHDPSFITVFDGPITGICNTAIINQTYYTGSLPALSALCSFGTVTGLVQTETGWTWSCTGANGGGSQTGCELFRSYCGDGILGSGGIGYTTGQEACDL